ncbi:MAG: GTP cyclohydrolase FolE2 [Armatimonadetes bacterium]|nr:GTP cyclohydrolase FolE2 [Armatimonadota bacterium]MCA1996985.1 GTP cyclohydrolase FolE2 [Armatimonadota bacterium]
MALKEIGTMEPLVDIQSSRDERNIPIDKVGVRNVRYPIAVRDREKIFQHTVGTFSLTVDLPREFKGTHMSRFIEVLSEHKEEFSVESIPSILNQLKERLKAEEAHLEVRFPFFKRKAAPVTGKESLMEYDCGFIAAGNSHYDLVMEVKVPVTTLCPCSKEISDRGAHNQRGIVTARLRFQGVLWMEEVIEAIERCASCDLYPLLKRPDEKYVTEHAYDNPRFVEDMVREVALAFERDDRVVWYEIEVENQESIHAHNAYAYLQRDKR